jgi:hypothetical protein
MLGFQTDFKNIFDIANFGIFHQKNNIPEPSEPEHIFSLQKKQTITENVCLKVFLVLVFLFGRSLSSLA